MASEKVGQFEEDRSCLVKIRTDQVDLTQVSVDQEFDADLVSPDGQAQDFSNSLQDGMIIAAGIKRFAIVQRLAATIPNKVRLKRVRNRINFSLT